MANKVYSNRISEYAHENGGRVLLLFLLFSLAIYQLIHAGFSTFAIICILPFLVLAVYAMFSWRMLVFWMLLFINQILQWKASPIPLPGLPMSLWNELLELTLIAIAIVDTRKTLHFERSLNLMLVAITIWCGFCCIEILNDTCGLGMNVNAWFTGARLMALQLVWILLVFSIYISSPQTLLIYLRVWALFAIFSAFWTWKQKTIGFTPVEYSWLYYGPGSRTHVLNGGTLIRYFSTFSDAANYGCNAASTAVAFLIFGITSKIKIDKIFFLLTFAIVTWGMFQSGTRTAIFALAAGFMLFLVLAKSIRILIPSVLFGVIVFVFLVFTNIGNGNQQIRRMRSAFNKKDASANVRDVNKAAISKYMKDAPWGIGIGIFSDNIPSWNKYKLLSEIPPDSEYVFIWVRTGPIGVTIFACCMVLMLAGACRVVLFRLKSPSLIGIGGGLCAAFASIQISAYANQVLYQYPNGLTFFGGLAIVYILPYLEPDWREYEQQRFAKQEEKKKIKLEKKLAKRV